MESVVAVTIPFFALIGCGYFAARRCLISENGIEGLNIFVFYFALPALLFRGMATQPFSEILNLEFVFAYFAASIAVFIAGYFLFRLDRASGRGAESLVALSGCYGNIGYLGLPLIIALLGAEAGVPVALMLSVDLVVLVSLAIIILESGRTVSAHPVRKISLVGRSLLINPLLLSIVGGIAFSALGWTLPVPVDQFTKILSPAAGPAAMFAMGATLVGRSMSSSRRAVVQMTAFKLIVHPLAVWLSMTVLFDVPSLWAKSAILAAAMPVAGTVYVLARRHGVFVTETSSAVLVSSVLSIVSFSALAAYLGA